MRAKIADVVIRVREVTLPDTCPDCHKSLVGEGGLFVSCLEHVMYEGVNGASDGPGPRGKVFQRDPVVPGVYTFFACGHCGGQIQTPPFSQEKVLLTTEDEKLRLEEALQNSVWSASIDNLVFGGKNF